MNILNRPQHMKKSRKRLPVSAYLGYLLICTLVLTGVSFAKFATTAGGSDSARVAAFVVEATGKEKDTLTIDCGAGSTTATYTLTVKNNNASEKVSEVAISYDVVLALPEDLPNGLTVTLDGNTGTVSEKKITFANVGTFAAGTSASKTHKLTVTANPNVVTNDITLDNISVNVIAEQID